MSLPQLVDKIISRQNDFCCVCFDIINEKVITMEHEVVVNMNKVESNMLLFDVLSTILNDETLSYISGFNGLCLQCTRMAVKSYTFVKKAKENTELLSKTIEGLSSSLDSVDHSLAEASLFITLNTEDFTTKQYIHTKRSDTASAGLSLFKNLKNILNEGDIKPKLEHECTLKHRSKKRLKSNLLTEKIMYDPNDSSTMKCRECLKVYPSIWSLRSHYVRVHAPKIYKCPDCPMKYGSQGCLKTHRDESHCTVVCSVCGKIFHNRNTLKIHELGHHLKLVCQKCGRIYKNKNTFNKHIEYNVCGNKSRASPSDAKFECDYCNKKYTQKMSLRVHIQFEHGNYKSYDCKWCQKKFWCKSRLNAHVVKHTQEKKFHCSTCDRNFVSKESLLYHTRIHTGEKPYECSQCDGRFLSASRRSEHVKRHHAGGTFQCDTCHGKFNSQSYLQKHKRMHLHAHSDGTNELNKHNEAPKLPENSEDKQFILQSNQIPTLSTVYNYDEIYLEVANDDYNIKIEP